MCRINKHLVGSLLIFYFYLDGSKNIYSDNNLISTDIIDSPLLIVLDEDDDDDEYQNVDLTATTTNSNHSLLNHKDKQTIVSNEISAKGNIIF
jgi:hypothetical protein